MRPGDSACLCSIYALSAAASAAASARVARAAHLAEAGRLLRRQLLQPAVLVDEGRRGRQPPSQSGGTGGYPAFHLWVHLWVHLGGRLHQDGERGRQQTGTAAKWRRSDPTARWSDKCRPMAASTRSGSQGPASSTPCPAVSPGAAARCRAPGSSEAASAPAARPAPPRLAQPPRPPPRRTAGSSRRRPP